MWFLITIFWTLSPFGSVDTKAIWVSKKALRGSAVTWAAVLALFLTVQFEHKLSESVYSGRKKIRQSLFHQHWETKDQRSLITHKILPGHWIKGTIICAKYCDTSKTSCHVFQTPSCCMDFFTFSSALQQRKEVFFLVIKSSKDCAHSGKKPGNRFTNVRFFRC